MIDNFLNDLKVKRFMAFGKEADFDLIYKLKQEGLIENKSKHEYQLTKEGYKAADMGYDKYIQSLEFLSNQSLANNADITIKKPKQKRQKKISKSLLKIWEIVSNNPLISTVLAVIIIYLISLIFNIDLK